MSFFVSGCRLIKFLTLGSDVSLKFMCVKNCFRDSLASCLTEESGERVGVLEMLSHKSALLDHCSL